MEAVKSRRRILIPAPSSNMDDLHPWTCVQSFRAFPVVCVSFLCMSLHPSKILHLFNHPVSGS